MALPFAGLFTNKTETPTTKNPFEGLFSNSTSQAKAPATIKNTGVAQPKTSAFPAGGSLVPGVTGKNGVNYPIFKSGYGASFKSDKFSGRPLLQTEKRPFQSKISTNRVATTFDPTIPQNLTRKVLSNGRMPVESSNLIRSRLGLGYNEQLDHVISLQLSGSNEESNLRGQKLTEKGTQPLLWLENKLGRDVINGEETGMSLEKAHELLAKAKGINLEDGTKGQDSYSHPFLEKAAALQGILEDKVSKFLSENFITEQIANNKGLIGNIIANITGDNPRDRAKSVKISSEKIAIKNKLIAEGKSEEEAIKIAKTTLTPTQQEAIMLLAGNFIGDMMPVKGSNIVLKGEVLTPKNPKKAEVPVVKTEATSLPKVSEPKRLTLTDLPTIPAEARTKNLDAYILDSKNLAKSQGSINLGINLDRMNISPAGKEVIEKVIEDVKPKMQEFTGGVLSNKEAVDLAESSSKFLKKAVGRDSTLEWEAAMLKTRQSLAAASESGVVDRKFVEDLLTVKTQATDIARKLQSLSVSAEAKSATSKEAILEAVLKVNQNIDEIVKAAEGVDFNDFRQAADFYRKFVAPKSQEWLDLVRYNSMLSSPTTHIVNVFSNLINTGFIAPVEKALTGGLDFLGSKFTGNPRKYFAGEGSAYLKGYFKNVGEAARSFSDVMSDRVATTNLDTRSIPLATTGVKGKIAKTLAYPLKLLEGMDRFFMTLGKSAEESALSLRESKGVKVPLKSILAEDAAKYRVFRQELFSENQGVLLDAVDRLTQTLQNLRNNPNPIVSMISKFTVAFLQTPMNIFKQGIEYSPVGFATLPNAANKTEQISKAILGSAVFAGAATLLASGRLSWSEPADSDGKSKWRAAGKQPYSVKVGDRWWSYQKLPPALAFPLAMVASIEDLLKNSNADATVADQILGAIAKYGEFLADQSYAKSIGDLLNAAKGGEAGITRLISNYPQQLIPYRALGGWLARLFDATQRKVDTSTGFVEQQIQQLMLNIPGLSQAVPARLDQEGNPIKTNSRVVNAFSPIKTSAENPELIKFLNQEFDLKLESSNAAKYRSESKSAFEPRYNEIKNLAKDGKIDEAKKLLDSLSEEDYGYYKAFKSADKARADVDAQVAFYPKFKEIRGLISSGKKDQAQDILNSLTDSEYKTYQKLSSKTKIPTKKQQ